MAFLTQIIKALNLYRKKTGTSKYFWVRSDPQMVLYVFCFVFEEAVVNSSSLASFENVGRFILTKGSPLELGLVVGAAMLQQHYGQQISSTVVLLLRRNCKNGRVRLVQIFLSFSPKGQPIVLVEVRQVFILLAVVQRY